jgi:exodeoxyribonuclease VII large subunit
LRAARQGLDLAAARLRPAVLAADLDRTRARLAEVEPRLNAAWARFIGRSHDAVDNFAGRLATHAERHESLLSRGYVVVRNAVAKVVTEAAGISPGAPLDLEFYDGRVGAVAGSKPRPRTRRPAVHPGQGSLF